MKTTEVGSRKNHGIVKSEAGKGGGKCMEAYGKDDSNYAGPANAERGKKLGGSVTNLAHSLSNTSAKQD